MDSTFVNVQVEEHDALPDGCCLRFRAQGEGRKVSRLAYESEAGLGGCWDVSGRAADGSEVVATAFEVDDSSAGTSLLVVGGDRGLRLCSVSTGETIAEAYLLLATDAVVA